MVGALKSNRCDTCRLRKIKCDQAWPLCGPCRRSNRHCPPRSSLKVIDDGATVRRKHTASLRGKANVGNDISGLFIEETIPLSPSERLVCAFTSCLHTETPSRSLNHLGASLSQMPRHFGSSSALDSVAACMVDSHSTITRDTKTPCSIKPQLHARALRSVQEAINDPKEWNSTNTLCAVLLLHRIESVFGESLGSNMLVHGSGLAALVQKRGPPDPSNTFDCAVIADGHMCIVEHALLRHTDCFLSQREWSASLDTLQGKSRIQTIYYKLLRQMSTWPTLIREKLEHKEGKPTLISLLGRIYHLRKELHDICIELDTLIYEENLVSRTVSTCVPGLVDEMFQIQDPTVALALCYHAMYSIIVLRILWSLADNDALCQSELEIEILGLSQRIWMLIDHGRRYKPLGLPILSVSLALTLESVNWEEREQITALVNNLESSEGLLYASWTSETLINQVRVYRGDRLVNT
ncbi:hypothetical protein BGW36DRAFT_384198 [Talaromyces proteolyticus]|uniref:Zn(2)-C6 fungal-type domain-containing protein n=1 Tax=Talaromyces proteolyticus TaxID=1131652 RepID=A0AAD4PTY3_9EURO|nr:uncharacterized protein BGW36DRAFT_384198 [Talaromyces proteolyticus]KAH8694028.1 hypothetical protein BGW36DRAFT_384198 [Talaromyces proteolyticus]